MRRRRITAAGNTKKWGLSASRPGVTGWALGVGRRILDELARHARERKPEIVLRDSAPPFDLARPNHLVDRYRQLTIERREV